MEIRLDKLGVLRVIATDETEQYALRQWLAEVKKTPRGSWSIPHGKLTLTIGDEENYEP